MQVPLGQRFRQVLTDEEHFSPHLLVQHLKEAKGVQVCLQCRMRSSLTVYHVGRSSIVHEVDVHTLYWCRLVAL